MASMAYTCVVLRTRTNREPPAPSLKSDKNETPSLAGDTNASSDLSLSHMVSENLPPRPSIVLDSSQLPRQRSAEAPPPQPPPPGRPETMC